MVLFYFMRIRNFYANLKLHEYFLLLYMNSTSCALWTLMCSINFMTYHDFDGH